MAAQVVFKDAAGRELTTEDLEKVVRPVRGERVDDGAVSAEAERLHEEGRAAGGRGEYDHARELLERAHNLAPEWPYPVYDIAFTYLLEGDSAKAEELYEKVDRMVPRGFFTAKTALDCLRRERAGALFPGFCKAYSTIEWMADKGKKKALLESIVSKFPALPVAWKDLSVLLDDDDARLQAINHGLEYNPDGETKGILLINKAMILHRRGDRDRAVEILGELALDPQSTLSSEALAKVTLANLLR